MAKKTLKLKMSLGQKFSIFVPDDCRESYALDQKKNKLCLTVEIEVGPVVHNFNIYQDQISNGGLVFGEMKDGVVEVDVSGVVEKKVNLADDEDLILFIQKDGSCGLGSKGFYDSKLNYYYIDGIEDKLIEIGVAKVE